MKVARIFLFSYWWVTHPSVIQDDIGAAKRLCKIVRQFETMMKVLPTKVFQFFRASPFGDILWQHFAIYPTNVVPKLYRIFKGKYGLNNVLFNSGSCHDRSRSKYLIMIFSSLDADFKNSNFALWHSSLRSIVFDLLRPLSLGQIGDKVTNISRYVFNLSEPRHSYRGYQGYSIRRIYLISCILVNFF